MGTSRLDGTGLFTTAVSGLISNYANLMTGNANGGLTLNDITTPSDDVNKKNLNAAFTSYLSSNFSNIDKNNDGKISQDELQNYTNALSQGGMTREQLTQMCAGSGMTNSLLETVLANFDKIDKNHDGKVTNEEIKLYGLDEEINGIKDKYKRVSEKSCESIFYPSSSSDETDESGSV